MTRPTTEDVEHVADTPADEERRIAAVAFESVTPMILTDENGRILRVNRAFEQMTGYPAAEVIGRTPAVLKSGRHDGAFYAAMWQRLLAEGRWEGEVWNRRRCGEIYAERLSISAVTAPDGRVSHYVGALVDITDRRHVNDTLREERDLITAGPSVVFKWGLDDGWPVTYVSPNVRTVFGYAPADLTAGRPPYADLVHPDDLERVAAEVEGHLASGETHYKQHYRFRHADGTWRWIDDFSTMVRDDDGTPRGINGYVLDVTERVLAAREVEAAHDHMTQILGALGEAVYGVDVNGRCTFVNPAALDLLGYAEAEVLGQDQHVLFHHSRPDGSPYPCTQCPIHQTLRDGRRRSLEEWFWRADGQGFPVDLTITALMHGGVVVGAVASFHDISDTKAAAEALAEERARLSNILWGTGVGTWEWNVQTGQTRFNERWAEIVGHTLEDISPVSIETWMGFAHPDDLAASTEALERHFRGEVDHYECEARMRHKAGHWVWVLDRGKVVSWTADGKPEWMAGTHWDISDRIQAEAALRQSEEHYRLAQTATGVGIWDWDVANNTVAWDENCWTMLGHKPSERLQSYEEWRARVHPDDLDGAEATVQARLAEGDGFVVDFRIRTVDDSWLWIQGRGQVISRDANGAPLRMMGTHTDISTRKQAEEILQGSRNRLDQLLGTSPAVVYAADPMTFNASYISANATILFGLEPDEILGQEAWWMNSLHPEDRDRVLAEAEAWFAGGAEGLLKHSYRMRRGDGSYVWVEDQLRARRDSSGTVVELVGSHVDVGAAKEAEEAVRVSEERFRSLFHIFPDGVVLIDLETGLPVQFNPMAARQLGYSDDEFARLTISDYEANETREEVAEHIGRIPKDGGDDFETLHRRKDGTLMRVHVTVMCLDLHDRPHVLAVFRDITERHRTQEELARSNAELEQFAYVASHDLRQPLRMVNSYTQLLERHLGNGGDETTLEFMGFIRDGAQRMDQMLVSLLEYSRVGRKGEPMEQVDSRALAEEAVLYLTPAIEEARAEVRFAGDWPGIRASRNEGVRLFQNLIGNAVKYRAPDRAPVIDLAARRVPGGWEFSVCDNGIGIDPKQFDRLFKVFQRLHTRTAYEGTGIGLAVCRKIVERHGGTIGVRSDGPDTGTCFVFVLPDTELA